MLAVKCMYMSYLESPTQILSMSLDITDISTVAIKSAQLILSTAANHGEEITDGLISDTCNGAMIEELRTFYWWCRC